MFPLIPPSWLHGSVSRSLANLKSKYCRDSRVVAAFRQRMMELGGVILQLQWDSRSAPVGGTHHTNTLGSLHVNWLCWNNEIRVSQGAPIGNTDAV